MRLVLLFLLLLHAQVVQSTFQSTTKPLQVPCKSTALTPMSQSIQCDLRAAAPASSFLLKVNFSGSHDDTKLNLETLLNGKPLVCAPGSLTYSEGEDGDISLVCKFKLPQTANTEPLLSANFKWFHAQFVDYQLLADPQ
jgi:hypothetical protein